MDLLCPLCGEPWDNDCLHEVEGLTYRAAGRLFVRVGCAAIDGRTTPLPRCLDAAKARPEAVEARRAIYDVNGDDLDGAAVNLEDFAYAFEQLDDDET
jgi:hypothetical protein